SATPQQLIKELTGTLILASANDYAGQTLIVQGAVRVGDALALGVGDGTVVTGTRVLDGAQLQMQSALGGTTIVANEALSLSGTGIARTGALLNTGGSTTWQGPITLAVDPGFAASTYPEGAVSFGVSQASATLTLDTTVNEGAGGPTGLSKVG